MSPLRASVMPFQQIFPDRSNWPEKDMPYYDLQMLVFGHMFMPPSLRSVGCWQIPVSTWGGPDFDEHQGSYAVAVLKGMAANLSIVVHCDVVANLCERRIDQNELIPGGMTL